MSRKVEAEHGIVCRLPGERFGYFGWPSIARMDDGTSKMRQSRLVVASSGLRTEHVCPFGKTVLNISTDDGHTWSAPEIINNSLLDDRDAGVVNLGGMDKVGFQALESMAKSSGSGGGGGGGGGCACACAGCACACACAGGGR